jgi:hypothetical protein
LWLGREKHRKTNVLLQLAICAAVGRDFLTFRFAGREPLHVVYIDYESKSRSLNRRYKAISVAMGLTLEEESLLKANLQIIQVRELERAGKTFPKFPVGHPKQGTPEYVEQSQSGLEWRGLISSHPADVYIIDPMRCLHAMDENDSRIEQLLSKIRVYFRGAAVVIAHHMRKRGEKDYTLTMDMRVWSDSARGSGAIKAHADVIVCQERTQEGETEVVHLGVFMKDGPDIGPIPLEESGHESFYWVVRPDLSTHLRQSYNALEKAGGKFPDKNAMVRVLVAAGIKKSSAYRHLKELGNYALLVERDGEWSLQTAQVVDEDKAGLDEVVEVRQ